MHLHLLHYQQQLNVAKHFNISTWQRRPRRHWVLLFVLSEDNKSPETLNAYEMRPPWLATIIIRLEGSWSERYEQFVPLIVPGCLEYFQFGLQTARLHSLAIAITCSRRDHFIVHYNTIITTQLGVYGQMWGTQGNFYHKISRTTRSFCFNNNIPFGVPTIVILTPGITAWYWLIIKLFKLSSEGWRDWCDTCYHSNASH